MLRFGPETGPVAVVAMPLFEEANRCRAFAVTLCRALARHGVASVLPDLPGQGESLVPLQTLSSSKAIGEGFEAAVAAVNGTEHRSYGVAIRSGALICYLAEVRGQWQFAPQSGPDLLRDLTRIKQAALPATSLPDAWYQEPLAGEGQQQPPVEVAGSLISANFFTTLKADVIWHTDDDGPWRVVRLHTDRRPADRYVPGISLWRRAEASNDPALAALLADDIVDWIAACEG